MDERYTLAMQTIKSFVIWKKLQKTHYLVPVRGDTKCRLRALSHCDTQFLICEPLASYAVIIGGA